MKDETLAGFDMYDDGRGHRNTPVTGKTARKKARKAAGKPTNVGDPLPKGVRGSKPSVGKR